jgi:NAD-dependent DNA ligase adenylation domain
MILELINRRKRQILVHSFLYYQLNESIISDHTFDAWCNELVKLLKDYPEEAKQSIYYEEFKDFDGSSGFDLPFHYPEIQNTGYKILKIHKGGFEN